MNESINIKEMLQMLEMQDRAITELKAEVSQRTETAMDYRNRNIMLERENGNLSQQIQILSSEKSKLKSKVQELADRIVRMNKADMILKENEKLKEDNERLRQENEKVKTDMQTEKERVENQYQSRLDSVSERENVLLQKEKLVNEKLKNIRSYVESESEEKSRRHRAILEKRFQAKTLGYQVYVISALLYGLLITVFTAVKTKQITDDFAEFFRMVGKGILNGWKYLYQFATFVSNVSDKVTQETVALILLWLIIILIVGIVVAGVTIGIIKLFIVIKDYYTERLMNTMTLTVTLVSLSLIVFWGKEIRLVVPVNLVLLLFLVQVIYVSVTIYLKKYNYKYWQ